MSARNTKNLQPFDPSEKMQSNTLKRHPKMDLNKSDLLRLLSYLEGELQARDVVIATLKAEKAKQLLYQAKYGRFGLGDPFTALQRDSDNMRDNTFDESAIKAMYDNQLAQLENLIATQRKAQLKMREQLTAAEKRYHKVWTELDDEKKKHAQDTAQGDDVTYMLEKERERLKQEIDFEKTQNKRLEKDLKKSLVNLEEERANSKKHKQVALMLIKERKQLMEKVLMERHKCPDPEQSQETDKDRVVNMAEGLVHENRKTMQLEATLEKQLSEFDTEREQLKGRLNKEEGRNHQLEEQITLLQQQMEQIQIMGSRDAIQSIEIKSSASPNRTPSRERSIERVTVVSASLVNPAQRCSDGGKHADGFGKDVGTRVIRELTPMKSTLQINRSSPSISPDRSIVTLQSPGGNKISEVRIGPATMTVAVSSAGPRTTNVVTTNSANTTVVTSGGSKISLHVGQPGSPRRTPSAGRGAPPPIPPNKPVLTSISPAMKPAPPPKVGITISKDRITVSGSESMSASGKSVQIPVNVVTSQTNATTGRSRDNSPLRKGTQLSANQASDITDGVNSPALDFLGPEMADLQEILVTMATGEGNSYSVDRTTSSPSRPLTVITSPIHKHAACGDLQQLHSILKQKDVDVNEMLEDGTTPLHCAAESGQEECVELLLVHGANVDALRDDKYTSLHAAACEGHYGCLKHLIDRNGDVNLSDQSNWSPLHWAASRGQTQCCRLLLENRALLTSYTNILWTPFHCAIDGDHVDCLRLLLSYLDLCPSSNDKNSTSFAHASNDQHITPDNDQNSSTKNRSLDFVITDVIQDVAYLAAIRETQDCLAALVEMCDVNLRRKDTFGRTVYDVASTACKLFIENIGSRPAQVCSVCVQLQRSAAEMTSDSQSSFTIGQVTVQSNTSWITLEEELKLILTNHFTCLDAGIKNKRTSRHELDLSPDSGPYTLGLTADSIDCFALGFSIWRPGSVCDKLPYEILSNNEATKIQVYLKGDGCETLAYDLLIPVPVLQNHIRLMEQYKNVVFYGPERTGKSYLIQRLSHCIARRERRSGRQAEVHHILCHENFSKQDLMCILKEKGCMVPVKSDLYESKAPILVLDDLEKINIAKVFGDILEAIEHRGKTYTFRLKDESGNSESFYFVNSFYIIATMNRTRSTGLDLSMQQRFRWVQFRMDTEPLKNLLSRHLLRKLIDMYSGQPPAHDGQFYKVVQWIISVWQRLNESISNLSLPDVVFGPNHFFSCQLKLDEPKKIFSWLRLLWNSQVAPVIKAAVIAGSGKENPSDRQEKVANTALFVIMQRAIVSGCPLSGEEKERYLSTFVGSNELDIPVKMEKIKAPSLSPVTSDLQLYLPSEQTERLNRTMPDERQRQRAIHLYESPPFVLAKRHLLSSSLSVKRRSLSESCIPKDTDESTPYRRRDLTNVEAKVPKLEKRPPVLLSFNTTFNGCTDNENTSAPKSNLHFASSLPKPSTPKSSKSNSSENLSRLTSLAAGNMSGFNPRLRASSPFSFSLASTTPTLNSFQFFDINSNIANNGDDDMRIEPGIPKIIILDDGSQGDTNRNASRTLEDGGSLSLENATALSQQETNV